MSIYFWYSAVLYTSQLLEFVKNAENDIFSLVSSNLISIFNSDVGHQEKIMSKSWTTIIQLNIFNESHPVATFWFSSKIGRPKSLLNAQGSLKYIFVDGGVKRKLNYMGGGVDKKVSSLVLLGGGGTYLFLEQPLTLNCFADIFKWWNC